MHCCQRYWCKEECVNDAQRKSLSQIEKKIIRNYTRSVSMCNIWLSPLFPLLLFFYVFFGGGVRSGAFHILLYSECNTWCCTLSRSPGTCCHVTVSKQCTTRHVYRLHRSVTDTPTFYVSKNNSKQPEQSLLTASSHNAIAITTHAVYVLGENLNLSETSIALSDWPPWITVATVSNLLSRRLLRRHNFVTSCHFWVQKGHGLLFPPNLLIPDTKTTDSKWVAVAFRLILELWKRHQRSSNITFECTNRQSEQTLDSILCKGLFNLQ